MAETFRSEKKILMRDLFDGRLEAFGIVEKRWRDSIDVQTGRRWLVNEETHLLAILEWKPDDSVGEHVEYFARTELDDPKSILCAITDVFDTPLFGDDEP